MTVKSVFKVLFAVPVIITLGTLVIEMYNVNIVGMQVKQNATMAAKQAAELYTQETYKSSENEDGEDEYKAFSTAMPDIVYGKSNLTTDNETYISGSFYVGNDTQDIWSALHVDTSDLHEFLKMTQGSTLGVSSGAGDKITKYNIKEMPDISGKIDEFTGSGTNELRVLFKRMNRLYYGLFERDLAESLASTTVKYKDPNFAYNSEKKRIGQSAINMADEFYTPVNLGVPFFQGETFNQMFRWNLAKLLSSGNDNNVRREIGEDGQVRNFVYYNGFQCYVDRAYISDLDYYILDKDSPMLQYLTGLNSNNIHRSTNNVSDENKYVTVVGIKYVIPMNYVGVTRIAKLISYFWQNGVQKTVDGNEFIRTQTNSRGEFAYSESELKNNDSNDRGDDDSTINSKGVLPATGELYYVLTR